MIMQLLEAKEIRITVYLKYANNPYQNGDGTNDTGKTPTDKNIVFTYKVLADKVDENGNA